MFGLSNLGYSRNMAAQHGGLSARGPAAIADTKISIGD